MLFDEAAGQKYPAMQGWSVAVMLPTPMHRPEVHVRHEDCAT